jgi:hypothetical protein
MTQNFNGKNIERFFFFKKSPNLLPFDLIQAEKFAKERFKPT